jgi:undecaprenyl-diphosphatase
LEFLNVALSGIIQGLTEFLPVSSSGHLALFVNIFGFDIDGDFLLFALILHLGTLLSVFIAYFKDIKELFTAFLTLIAKIFTGKFKYSELKTYEKFVILIFIATIPLVLGAFIDSRIEALVNNSKLIGALLFVNAGILFMSDKIKTKAMTETNATPKNAILVGLAQLIAVFPGISRSGATITGGLLNGFTREFAVKFSFILSIPAILGASVFHFIDLARSGAGITSEMISTSVIGFVFAFVFGLAAIIMLRLIARNRRFWIFSIWCAIVGTLALIFG